jgi:toxin-antitoxin system PIN domain toxin
VKLVDTNVLLYAIDEQSKQHNDAKGWLDSALSGQISVGFSWLALVGFVRISTHPRFFAVPMSTAEAMDCVDLWTGARSAHVLQPGVRHSGIMRELLEEVGHGGALVSDVHLAALAKEHKATVVTFDSDFARFAGVRWEKPWPADVEGSR